MHSASSLISFERNRLPLVIPLPKRPWAPDLEGSHPIKRPPTLNSSSSLPRPFTSIRSTPPSPQQAPYPSVPNLGPRPSPWLRWPTWSPGQRGQGPQAGLHCCSRQPELQPRYGWRKAAPFPPGPLCIPTNLLPRLPPPLPLSSAPRYFFLIFFFSLGKVCSAPAPGGGLGLLCLSPVLS